MADSLKQFGLRMMSGEDKSLPAAIARIATATAEPFYSAAMTIRNACYDRGIFRAYDLGRPTISIGNVTTGGTGKTPVVQWLCEELQKQGKHPAVLLRGYGHGAFSDEAELLQQALGNIPVQANPSRVAGAVQVLKANPAVDVFVLDDAFQHRKAGRDFNLVLISATLPFGYGHVLPRGLLREPLQGLKRADAFLVTRSSLGTVEPIDRFLGEHHPTVPIFHSDHQITGVRDPVTNEESPMESFEGERVFITSGIGDPIALEKQIASFGCHVVGTRWFPDHYVFTLRDMIEIDEIARKENADIVMTTEKDWVKIKSQLPQASQMMLGVLKLVVSFRDSEGDKLIQAILTKIVS